MNYSRKRPGGLATSLLWPLNALGALEEKRPNVGGQAVIEGVMMRAPVAWAVSVRKPDGQITTQVTPYRGISQKFPFLGLPFLRGSVVLFESLILGLKALNYSADQAVKGEEAAQMAAQAQADLASSTETQAKTGNPEKKAPAGLGFWALAGTMIFSLGLALVLFLALPHLLTMLAGYFLNFTDASPWFHFLDGVIKFIFFITYVVLIGFVPDIRKVYGYHGAEHQAIYAFENGSDLTVLEAGKYSAFHPRCGTAFIFLVLAVSIFSFAAILPMLMPTGGGLVNRLFWGLGLKFLLMFPLAGLAYEVTRLAGRNSGKPFWRMLTWPGLLLQRLTTRPPDDGQREVAIAALKAAISGPAETL